MEGRVCPKHRRRIRRGLWKARVPFRVAGSLALSVHQESGLKELSDVKQRRDQEPVPAQPQDCSRRRCCSQGGVKEGSWEPPPCPWGRGQGYFENRRPVQNPRSQGRGTLICLCWLTFGCLNRAREGGSVPATAG